VDPGLADAAYSNEEEIGWTRAAWDLGFSPLTDVNSIDLGPKGDHQGALVVDDVLLCPATPPGLRHIARPNPRKPDYERELPEYDRKVAQREDYAMVPHGNRDAAGYQRFMCPAAAGRVSCPLKSESIGLPHTFPSVTQPPKHPPACCTQGTITVPPTVSPKITQKLVYFTPEWRLTYRRRTAIERAFSDIKNDAHLNLRRGAIRVMGRTKISLYLAVAWAVRNEFRLDSFAANDATHGARAVPLARRCRIHRARGSRKPELPDRSSRSSSR
jgi:hypothetical protein